MNAITRISALCSAEVASGYMTYVVNSFSSSAGCNWQLCEVTQSGVALELVEMLKPAMPASTVSMSRRAHEGSPEDALLTSARVKDVVIWLRDVDQPGETFLRLLGMRGNPRETNLFDDWSISREVRHA